MPVMTCSQRTAKLSHSQKIAKSSMHGPLLARFGLAPREADARCADGCVDFTGWRANGKGRSAR
jgi:hypothetical protein